jgi:hypothetical protein
VLRDYVCEDDIPTRSSIASSVSFGFARGSKLPNFSTNFRLTKRVTVFLGMHGNLEHTVECRSPWVCMITWNTQLNVGVPGYAW